MTLQKIASTAAVALAVGVVLSACAASLPAANQAPTPNAASPAAAAPANVAQRDLTPAEKKVIIAAVALNLKDPGSAKYHWTKFPATTTEDSLNYCATVDAKSPYPAYDGRQAYILEAKVLGDRVIAATMGLIAGGKDVKLVAKMCAKYGLDPNKAT